MPTVAGDYFNFGMGSENSFWIDAGMDFSEVDIEITLSNGQAFNADDLVHESLNGTFSSTRAIQISMMKLQRWKPQHLQTRPSLTQFRGLVCQLSI